MSAKKRIDRNLVSLIDMLASEDGATRLKARKLLVAIGKPAVAPLRRSLQESEVDHVRWEAVKALGGIGDPGAIPPLVKALQDRDPDVRWLAAEALRKFKRVAWPPLLRALIRGGPDSVLLRETAHHVLRNQKENGYNDVLATLTKALVSSSAPISTKVAAYDFLRRIQSKQ